MTAGVWRYRLLRLLGRLVTRTAALLTLERMPPFVSTSAVVIEDGKVLTVFDPIRSEPVLPGGHLTWRETPEAAVCREVEEETGYLVQPGRLIGVFAGEQWTGEPGIVRVIFEAQISGGELRSSAEGEARWLPLAEYFTESSRDAPVVRRWCEREA